MSAQPTRSDLWRQTYMNAGGGYMAAGCSECILYTLANYRTQRQANVPIEWKKLTRGVLWLPWVGIAPSISSFFLLYTPTRHILSQDVLHNDTAAVLLASLVCAVPASIMRIPADVVQKRLALGAIESPRAVMSAIIKEDGWRGLWVGWRVNLVKDVPLAALKMSLYEVSTCEMKHAHRCLTLSYTNGREA
jgi:hypothetical protein